MMRKTRLETIFTPKFRFLSLVIYLYHTPIQNAFLLKVKRFGDVNTNRTENNNKYSTECFYVKIIDVGFYQYPEITKRQLNDDFHLQRTEKRYGIDVGDIPWR